MSYVRIVQAVADAIREVKEVPSGHLYASLMPTGISLARYELLIDTLCRAGLVQRTAGHVLKWVGPTN